MNHDTDDDRRAIFPVVLATVGLAQARPNYTIDYRATYIYGIGNGNTPLIALHWAALILSSKYKALAKIN